MYSESEIVSHNHHNKSSLIFTFGNSTPTNQYDSYGSKGFTYKFVYERPIKNNTHFRYNFGWQNISFGENVVSYDEWLGLQVREGEKANLFDVGIKFILNNGIAGNGLFRPYMNTSVGVGYFRQYTEYDYPNTFIQECDNFWTTLLHVIFDDDCDITTDYNINTVVNDRMTSSFMILDLGTNFAFNNNSRYAIEFGIRYSMIRNIQSSDWSNWEDIDSEQSFQDIIGRKLDADYQSVYLGLSWYFPNYNKKYKRNRPGKGKMI